MTKFEWSNTKQLGIPQLLFAAFLPSGFAFIGFHAVLPILFKKGIPAVLAWPLVASIMLLLLVIIGTVFIRKEAGVLSVSIKERLCLKRVSKMDWLITAGLVLLIVLSAGPGGKLSIILINFFSFNIPEYMPFFLNPEINPMGAAMEQLSPGYDLSGKFFLTIPILITLMLNVLTEDIYFRAWMQPKMEMYGKFAWVISGILFALYHTFQIWLLPTLIIATCSMAYITQRTKSIIPSLTVHFVVNFLLGGMGVIMVISK